MRDHIKIRQEYSRLVRAGKHSEAQKILEIIWGRKKDVMPIVKETPLVKEVTNKPKVVKQRKIGNDIDSLLKIKGIGKKTISDIKVMFSNIDYLVEALKENRVALRDDIVEKLKGVLI